MKNYILSTSNKCMRQHIVWLRVKTMIKLWLKPCLLLAAIFLSVILASCGRLYMEGYMPHEIEIVNQVDNTSNEAEVSNQTQSPVMPTAENIPVATLEATATHAVEATATPSVEATPTPTLEATATRAVEATATPSVEVTPTPSVEAIPSPALEQIATPSEEVTPSPAIEAIVPPPPTVTPTPRTTQEPQSEVSVKIVNPYVPYTYDQMIEDSLELKETYPDILSLELTGHSVEGRELTVIKLGKGEKKIILLGAHHAREYISSSYLMKMIEEYAKEYYSQNNYGNYNVKNLLDQVTMYIVPMVNPDGVNLVINGIEAVKNQGSITAMAMLKKTYKQWKANINGVDLNRQYPAQWDKKYDEVGKPASESFKGDDSATEPEIKAMMELSRANDFILAASFHTKGNVIFWADRGTVNSISGVKDMTKRLCKLTNYTRMPVSEDPAIYGAGYENWFRLEFLRPAFCIELTPYNNTDVPHDDKKFDNIVWDKAKYIGLFLADEALKR